ncbi:PAS domain-containing sensor histidine kinase [bacterium]|nr:PAS domain-containing sensor histidine kinase [bacterium]
MELQYHQYFEKMPCYITIHDRDLKIIEANQLFTRTFGDYEDRYCYQVFKHRSEKCERCLVEKTFKDGRRYGGEGFVKDKDGKSISLLYYTTPILDNNGKLTTVMTMGTDITELTELQKQLKDSQKRYQTIFESVPCFISLQDRNLKIIESNRQFKESFGSFLGCNCWEVYKHRTEECFPCAVRATFMDGQVHQSEEVVTTKDGRKVNTIVYTAPVKVVDGVIETVMEMSTDITQIRELQSQLTSLGLLIGSISHGIKGLLNSLDGGVYLVNSGMKKNDQKRIAQGWDMVQRNMARIRSMVLDILYYAKDREPDWHPINALDAIEEVSSIIETKAKERGVEFHRNFNETIGEFEGDAKAVRSMLMNLLENSLDACRLDKKEVPHFIKVSLNGNENHVEFEIEDNGTGMDQETREKAFSLFFSSKGVEGTGLGLFISNKIALAHGGSIKLESEINKGTRFIVRLPRKKLQEQPEESYTL